MRIGILLVVFILLLCGWWIAASDYGDAVVSGTYHLVQSGVECTLILKPDHTFDQQLRSGGLPVHAHGNWQRVGEGGISFSKDFLAVPGEELEPDGSSFADIHKMFGFHVTLEMRRYHVVSYYKRDSQTQNTPLGTYDANESGVQATLTLNPDHSFVQNVSHFGIASRSQGTWSTGTKGQIDFSRTFLKISGEQLNQNESATVEIPQQTNLQIAIANTSRTDSPIFRKH